MKNHNIKFRLNGSDVRMEIESSDVLLDVLRNKLGIKSPKVGCDRGDCGTCTVFFNGFSGFDPIRRALAFVSVLRASIQTLGLRPSCERVQSLAANDPSMMGTGGRMTTQDGLSIPSMSGHQGDVAALSEWHLENPGIA